MTLEDYKNNDGEVSSQDVLDLQNAMKAMYIGKKSPTNLVRDVEALTISSMPKSLFWRTIPVAYTSMYGKSIHSRRKRKKERQRREFALWRKTPKFLGRDFILHGLHSVIKPKRQCFKKKK